MKFNPAVAAVSDSPISAAFAHVPNRAGVNPLLDMSQAAPAYPTAPVVSQRIAEVAFEPDGGRYSPSLGLPELRSEFAAALTADYSSGSRAATIAAGSVVITAGCNQAFCVAASALAGPGDEIIVCVPYYFNHTMWCEAQGINVVLLPVGPDGAPSPERAAGLISSRTRAILLVTPGNPTGVTLSPESIRAFADLARQQNCALILDETYRNFRPTTEPAHSLFQDADWGDHIVSLHSFSKDLAIPGYRVGAIVGGSALTLEVAKLLDCVAISAPRIGQEAALAGLRFAGEWRTEQAHRIQRTLKTFQTVMADAPGGFELVHSGAFFGWVRHPFGGVGSEEVVHRLITEEDLLAIPGTAFMPTDQGFLRFSFANLEPEALQELASRLTAPRPLNPPRRKIGATTTLSVAWAGENTPRGCSPILEQRVGSRVRG